MGVTVSHVPYPCIFSTSMIQKGDPVGTKSLIMTPPFSHKSWRNNFKACISGSFHRPICISIVPILKEQFRSGFHKFG